MFDITLGIFACNWNVGSGIKKLRYIRVRKKSSFEDGIESFGIRFERKKKV